MKSVSLGGRVRVSEPRDSRVDVHAGVFRNGVNLGMEGYLVRRSLLGDAEVEQEAATDRRVTENQVWKDAMKTRGKAGKFTEWLRNKVGDSDIAVMQNEFDVPSEDGGYGVTGSKSIPFFRICGR